MKPEVKKYSLTVFGDSYSILSDEPEQRVISAACHVDQLMHEIAAKAPDMPLQKIAVLAALKVALDLHSGKLEYDDTKAFIKHLIASIPSAL
jgi:cell division protein ZapA (FtsZ GTPase activity inhibitor)